MYSYKTKESKLKKYIILIILMIIVSTASIFIYDMYLNIEVKSYDITEESVATRLSNDENEEITNTLEEVVKCVVGISKIQDAGTSIFLKDSTASLGMGTGIIVSKNGYILTNWHVAGEKYNTCYVTLDNSNEYNGTVVWADKDLDLAIVKINASGLNYLEFADSDNIKLGQKVYAIGNPVGMEFQRTVTSGIISALGRDIIGEDGTTYNVMQTDCAINSGNSGGALVNSLGQVIGINTLKLSGTGIEGVGFSIPINDTVTVYEQLINYGKVLRPYIGISGSNLSKATADRYNLPLGIYVEDIAKDSNAAKSDLKVEQVRNGLEWGIERVKLAVPELLNTELENENTVNEETQIKVKVTNTTNLKNREY